MIGQSSESQSGTVSAPPPEQSGFSSFHRIFCKSHLSESKKIGWESTTMTSQAEFSLIAATANWQWIEAAEVRWLASTVAEAYDEEDLEGPGRAVWRPRAEEK